MAKYYISAIRKSNVDSHITHVLVHSPISEGRFYKGIVYSKSDIIRLMADNTFRTATYDYTNGCWRNGAEVGKVRIGGVEYLRTDRDASPRDNLGNLLLIDELR